MPDLDKIPKNWYDRLRSVAFWHWEYQRRNPAYRKWSKTIQDYLKYFDSIGEIENMSSPETFFENVEHAKSHDGEDWQSPYVQYLLEAHGPDAQLKYFKFCILGAKFEDKFKRIYREHWIGMDSEVALSDILDMKTVSFDTDDKTDLIALFSMHEEWIVQFGGEVPSYIGSFIEDHASAPFSPDATPEQTMKIGIEYQALNAFNKAVKCVFEDTFIDEQTMQAVYKLSISGKRINTADLTRLSVLWMWDYAYRANPDDLMSEFDNARAAVWEKINEKGMGGEKGFNAISSRRPRVLTNFKATNKCIQTMRVFHLNS